MRHRMSTARTAPPGLESPLRKSLSLGRARAPFPPPPRWLAAHAFPLGVIGAGRGGGEGGQRQRQRQHEWRSTWLAKAGLARPAVPREASERLRRRWKEAAGPDDLVHPLHCPPVSLAARLILYLRNRFGYAVPLRLHMCGLDSRRRGESNADHCCTSLEPTGTRPKRGADVAATFALTVFFTESFLMTPPSFLLSALIPTTAAAAATAAATNTPTHQHTNTPTHQRQRQRGTRTGGPIHASLSRGCSIARDE
jgi:hypothetical protein